MGCAECTSGKTRSRSSLSLWLLATPARRRCREQLSQSLASEYWPTVQAGRQTCRYCCQARRRV